MIKSVERRKDMWVNHPDGGFCNTDGMTNECYGCVNYGLGLTDRCKERVKAIKKGKKYD